MIRKTLSTLLAMAVLVAFSFPVLAQETLKGKVDALDKEGKKITIAGTEYDLSDEAAEADVAVDDEVEATTEEGIVKSLTKAAVEEAPAEEGGEM